MYNHFYCENNEFPIIIHRRYCGIRGNPSLTFPCGVPGTAVTFAHDAARIPPSEAFSGSPSDGQTRALETMR